MKYIYCREDNATEIESTKNTIKKCDDRAFTEMQNIRKQTLDKPFYLAFGGDIIIGILSIVGLVATIKNHSVLDSSIYTVFLTLFVILTAASLVFFATENGSNLLADFAEEFLWPRLNRKDHNKFLTLKNLRLLIEDLETSETYKNLLEHKDLCCFSNFLKQYKDREIKMTIFEKDDGYAQIEAKAFPRGIQSDDGSVNFVETEKSFDICISKENCQKTFYDVNVCDLSWLDKEVEEADSEVQSLLLEQIKEKCPDLPQISDAEIKNLLTAKEPVLLEANEDSAV